MRPMIGYGVERTVRVLLLITVASVPFSVKLYARSIDLEVIFPAEPLIALTAVLVTRLLARRPLDAWNSVRSSPIPIAVVVYLCASVMSAMTSSMPIVSVKALVVRLAYVVVFFFGPIIAHAGQVGVRRLLVLHAWLLLPIVLWSLAAQVEGGFDRASAGFVMYPFYMDRTIWSAALSFGAIALLVQGAVLLRGAAARGNGVLHAVGGMLLLCAVVVSYTRAAWLALAAAGGLALLLLGARRWPRATLVTLALLVAFAFLLVRRLPEDPSWKVNASAHRTGIGATLRSFTNLSTDPSNMERMNRWSCAWRMFRDEPLLGHGLGTYQFVFLPYQRAEERTPISPPDTVWVNRRSAMMSGDRAVVLRPGVMALEYSGGSAHSEYLLALSEAGLIGVLALLAVLGTGLVTGTIRWWRGEGGVAAGLVPIAFMGLFAYAVHGIFNNYLDDCKLAMPFWTSLAALACTTAGQRPTEGSVD